VNGAPPTLTLYTRQGCHLCEEALAVIERARPELPAFTLQLRDISADERLHDAYFERIPVLELDGRELAEYVIDEETLSEALLDGDGVPPA
jgi:glutaredoxin